MKLIHLTLALCCFATALPSQIETTHKEKLRKKIEAMKKAMREGNVRNYNVYVKVRLNNGNPLQGVVKNGEFVELADGIDFVSAAKVDERGAGMRIWYTAGTNSYIFLRYDQIQKYTIGSKLSNDQVKLIELKLERELEETKQNYKRVQEAARKLRESGREDLKGGDGKTKEDREAPKLPAAQAKLLKDFPPSEGWGKEMIDRLKKRRITLGVYPNAKEQRFEKIYDAWAVAFDESEKLKKAAEDAAGSGGDDSEKKPEKNSEKEPEKKPETKNGGSDSEKR